MNSYLLHSKLGTMKIITFEKIYFNLLLKFLIKFCLWRINDEPPTREKLVKNTILRGLKLRGLTWNHMNTPYFIYEIDQRKKLNTLGDFENQKPTHIDATHAFSKILKNFQNRIPRELNQNLYISRICINHWISSNFLN